MRRRFFHKHHRDETFTEGSIAYKMFWFAVPILLGNLLQTINGTINSIWIGRFLGENEFAGASNANIVIFLVISSILGLSLASTIMVAQSIGARDETSTKRVVGTSFTFFLCLSIVVTAFGLSFDRLILHAIGTPQSAFSYALVYMDIVFIGNPAMFTYSFLMSLLRGTGDSRTPFIFLGLATAIDLCLNPVLIFAAHMGVAGSATSWLVSEVISLVGLVIAIYRQHSVVCLHKRDFRYLYPDWRLVRTIVAKGVPMGLQMIVVSTSGLAMMSLVNRFGASATAAFSAAMQLNNYIQMPAMAIGQAVSTVAAQNVGAGKWNRVYRSTWIAALYNLVLTGGLVILVYLLNRQVIGLFLRPGRAMDIGLRINAITLWGFVLFGITFVISGVVRATGAVTVPLVITFVALWIVRIPVSYYLARRIGIEGLWWSFPVGFVIGTILSIVYYFFGRWRKPSITTVSQGGFSSMRSAFKIKIGNRAGRRPG